MRFMSIAGFLFCVHIAMAFFNASTVFVVELQPNDDWINSVSQDDVVDESYVQNQINADVGFDLGDLIRGFFYFVWVLGASIVAIPLTFMQFGVPMGLASLLSIPFYFMYFLAIAQWISNRNAASMR